MSYIKKTYRDIAQFFYCTKAMIFTKIPQIITNQKRNNHFRYLHPEIQLLLADTKEGRKALPLNMHTEVDRTTEIHL